MLALAAWLPVVAGAILATYGNTVWNNIGVGTWAVGLALQLGAFLFFFSRSGREHREDASRPAPPGV